MTIEYKTLFTGTEASAAYEYLMGLGEPEFTECPMVFAELHPWYKEKIVGVAATAKILDKRSMVGAIRDFLKETLGIRAAEQLAAAAPDLLASNANLSAHVRSMGHPDDAVVKALLEQSDAAIAKATGKQ